MISKKLLETLKGLSKKKDAPVIADTDLKVIEAKKIIGGDVVKRRSEQTININSILLVVALVGMPVWWISAVEAKNVEQQERKDARATERVILMQGTPTPGSVSVEFPVFGSSVTPEATQTPTPEATQTPTPEVTPAPPASGELIGFYYSYYYPNYGGVNCHGDNWNETTKTCKDITSSGYPWSHFLDRGVAIHPSLIDRYPFGTIFHVHYPPALRGDYIVIDLCSGCIRDGSPNLVWLDFLSGFQRADWAFPVVVEVIYQ
jgi:hypothetical protein